MTMIAGPGKEVSEKSLELNVCAELLQHVRTWPGCGGALWLGLTQAQERRKGLDELIRNVGHGVAFLFQFKSPWPTSRVDSLYKFSINEIQHAALERLVTDYPNDVNPDDISYVFPLYSTWEKADQYAPELVRDTWLMPVSAVPLASLTQVSQPKSQRHRVEIARTNSGVNVTVHSPEVVGKVVNAEEYLGERIGRTPSDDSPFGVASEVLLDWFAGNEAQNLPVRFRGLNALFVPRD